MLRNKMIVSLVFTIGTLLMLGSFIESSSVPNMMSMSPSSSFNSLMTLGSEGLMMTSRAVGRGLSFLDDTAGSVYYDLIASDTNSNITEPKKHDPDRDRSVAEIIRSRGFEVEEYDVITKDGYILTIQRIVNPRIKPKHRANSKPIIIQHGLLTSSADFVITSVVVKPEKWPKTSDGDKEDDDKEDDDLDVDKSGTKVNKDGVKVTDTQEHPNALGFYMANRGYDVFLTNSRGNQYGMRHVKMNVSNPKFWAFTFDEQIKYDLPDTIQFVLKLTNKTKLGYVGHSQGTLMIFGLLSERPEYADIVEPVVALAPVAYVNNCITPVKVFSAITPVAQNVDSVFLPPSDLIKYLNPIVCGPRFIREEVCANVIYLTCGFDMEEVDFDRADAYLGHLPAGSSTKNLAHYGQLVLSGRFAHFDHGLLGNQRRYNQTRAPDYDLTKIRSKSIALFIASNDWIASPTDVQRLRNDLQVEPFAVYNISEIMPKWNHIDFVYAKHAGEVINPRIEEVFKAFD